MRHQGRITDWEDDRGFGFITPNSGAEKVFVDISAFVQRQLRPNVDQIVTYEFVADPKEGGRAAEVKYVAPRDARYVVSYDVREVPGREPFFRQFVIVVIAVAVGLYGWERFQARIGRSEGSTETSHVVSSNNPNKNATAPVAPDKDRTIREMENHSRSATLM